VISRGGEAALDKIIKSIVLGGGDQGDEGDDVNIISSDKVLTLFAGFALFLYAIKLGIEYYREEILGEGDDDDGDNNRDDYGGGDEEVGAGWCCCGENIGGYDKVVQNAVVDETTDGGKAGGGTVRPLLSSKNVDDDDVQEESFDENNIDDIDEFDNEEELQGGDNSNDQCAGEMSSEKCAKTKSKSSPNNDDDNDTNIKTFEIEPDYNDNVQHNTNNDNNNSPKSCLSSTSRTLPIVAFLGSLDDLTLFVPMLVGKTFGIFELILGSIVAGTIIVMLCCFITKCEMVSNFLMRMPMAVIVAVFSVILLVRGLNME